MGVTKSRTARLRMAAGPALAVIAILGSPSATADSGLTCSNGQVAMDGTCAAPSTLDHTSDSLGLSDGRVSDLSTPADFDVSGAPSEAYLSERGY